MTRIATSAGSVVAGLVRGGREIGPIGTSARVPAGLLAIVLPIAVDGIGWWDLGAALVAFPLIATSSPCSRGSAPSA